MFQSQVKSRVDSLLSLWSSDFSIFCAKIHIYINSHLFSWINLLKEKKCTTFQIIHHSVLKNVKISKLQRQMKLDHPCKLFTLTYAYSVAQLCSDSCDPWTVAHQAPLSVGFFRQEYWSGLPFPPSGDLPNLGIEPASPVSPVWQADSSPLSHQGSHWITYRILKMPVHNWVLSL